MPRIAQFYLKQSLIGFGIAALFVAGILYFNVVNLWHLISTSNIGLMALVVFWVLNGIVFAGVQMAVAVMLLADDDKNEGGPRGRSAQLIPVPTKTRSPHRKPLSDA